MSYSRGRGGQYENRRGRGRGQQRTHPYREENKRNKIDREKVK
jgi:hypothetical protein